MEPAFRRVVHCDWSKDPGKRWGAAAERDGAAWRASGPFRVPAGMAGFVTDLVDPARGPTLAAFDFPIGLPRLLRAPMGFDAFLEALDRFGEGDLADVLRPAHEPREIGPRRPFYPDRPGERGRARLAHLLAGLGAGSLGDLLRVCERGGDGAPFGGCMLWLVGAKTVGKAAIHGWTEVVRPARSAGARLWPFDGDLPALASGSALVLAESYPADAVRQLGLTIGKKTDQGRRAALGSDLSAWAAARRVVPDDGLAAALRDGFPSSAGGDDGFDAVVGLLAAIAVAAGEREAAPPLSEDLRRWEGWILGRGSRPGHSIGSSTPSASSA